MSLGSEHVFPQHIPKSAIHGTKTYLGLVKNLVLSHKRISLVAFGTFIVLYNLTSILYQPTASMNFSQAASCTSKFTLFPSLQRIAKDSQFNVVFAGGLSVAGFKIGSGRVCAVPSMPVTQNAIHAVRYGLFGGAVGQRIMVESTQYPKLNSSELSKQTIAVNQPVKLELSHADAVFDYQIVANNNPTICEKEFTHIKCDLTKAELKQGKEYGVLINRMFDGTKVENVYEGVIKTAEPLKIIESSIAQSDIVYEPINSVTFRTSQKLTDSPKFRIIANDNQVSHEVIISEESATINFYNPLPWRSKVQINIENITAESGATLEEDYVLHFQTSGGPKLIGSNLSSQKVEPNQRIALNFDQNVDINQNFVDKIKFTGSSRIVSANITAAGGSVFVQPNSSLEHCANYEISIDNSIVNEFAISGDSTWKFNFKTRCGLVTRIGSSVNGRGIHAYTYGSGSSVVVFVGAMHGNESSSRRTLNDLMDDLENDSSRIPAHRKVVIIPDVNPDGTSRNGRTNSRNVDLNRNFPADDWQELVYMPGGIESPQGGGYAPLSEPESAALASYITALSPRLVLTYHAVASVVIGNGSGDSDSLAGVYAQHAGYSHAFDSHADEIFSYPTTGEFEDWLHDKMGIPTLLVELGSMSSSQFSKNKNAIWQMITLP